MNYDRRKKDNSGCAKIGVIAIILLFLLPIWGLSGMMHGESFMGGIGESIGAWIVLIVVGTVGYGILKTFNK
ncbi:hypothetical protein [Flavobacterium xinjiangense]|uniref:Uncharacterized protein n=1 Tax=Flavobacterium xinjiangense TaxID=178356 RepID=A0A1M7MIE2_9FLAO|nr:hypothetical protein [Flavobacterium xinjiangense]SHM90598.1 hypothetical protein SAMN05216269_108141 [Flavobacterium xinjiangense]